jgi:hypothetical protein
LVERGFEETLHRVERTQDHKRYGSVQARRWIKNSKLRR